MNRLPTPPPLPADVRERALRTVLDGIDAPPRRRRAPFLAAAAAVVVALTVSIVVPFSGPGPDEPSLGQLGGGGPAVSGDAAVDLALARCAAAVARSGRQADYPPAEAWRATELILRSRDENVVAVNDSFVCFAASTEVALSSVRGTPAGAAEVMRLTSGVVVVTNPQRRAIQVYPEPLSVEGQRMAAPTDPVRVLLLNSADTPVSGVRLVVSGSYDGPVPEPAPTEVQLVDRLSAPRSPDPPGTSLTDCLASAIPGSALAVRTQLMVDPPAQLGYTSDGYTGFCVQTPLGPVFAGDYLPSGAVPAIVASRSVGGVSGVLVVVPPDTARVELTSAIRTVSPCALSGGLALCTLAGEAAVTVTVYGPDGLGTPVPVP